MHELHETHRRREAVPLLRIPCRLAPALPLSPDKSVVANRYLVGKVLEFNGDGVTYAGWDMTERIAVKVREFLPDAICSRKTARLRSESCRAASALIPTVPELS